MTAELFSIRCTTCQARLKVCHVEAVGKILSCPRCHSMVDVVPPDQWQPPDAPVAAEESASVSAAGAAVAVAAGDPIVHVPESDPALPAVPQGPSTSSAEWWGHKMAITTAVGGLAVGSLALLAFYVFGRQAPAGAPLAESPAGIAQTASSSPKAPSSNLPDATPAANLDDSRSQQLPNAQQASSTAASVPPTRPVRPLDPGSDAPIGGNRAGRPETTELDSAMQPAPIDLAANRTTGRTEQAAARLPPTNDLPETTSPSALEVPGRAAVTTPPAAPSSDAERNLESADQGTAVSGNQKRLADDSKPRSVPQPTAEPVDVEARLNDPMVQINFQDVALLTMTRFLIELTRIPITLDLDSLEAADITPISPVSVHQQATTVRKVLSHIVTQRKLSYRQADGQIVIGGPHRDATRVVYRVGDLVRDTRSSGSRARVAEIIALVECLIAPETWQINGGDGRMKEVPPRPQGNTVPPIGGETGKGRAGRAPSVRDGIEVVQTPVVQQNVARFFTRLRLARDLPTDLPTAGQSRVTLDTRRLQAGDTLEQRLTFTFARPTPLPQIAEALGRLSQLTLVVNWRSLAPLGITPATGITCSAVDRPFGEALTEQLAHYDLDWRAVDRSTLEILSRADAARKFDVEFHR
ncbi:MAG: hypothetical protein ACC645_18345, partial [Pirellulales bacterium]